MIQVPLAERRRLAAAFLARHRRPLLWTATGLAALAVLTVALVLAGGGYAAMALAQDPQDGAEPSAEEAAAARKLARLAPRGVHVLVDTYNNRLRVLRGQELLHEARCSTGSGVVLRDPEQGREWIFDTPQGERQVIRKVREPVWVKPDWAFIEEGMRPPERFRDRVDEISMGRYGLYLGDGYLIHGTIFQTLLGRRITHGCIRLGDNDLETVYRLVPLGARVILY